MTSRFNFNPDSYSNEDQLGFDHYITTLSSMICDKNFKTPFCIGVYGDWGSGKTSFMRILSNRLKEKGTDPVIIPVWFNPWRFEKEEHLIIPFLKIVQLELDNYKKANRGNIKKVGKLINNFGKKVGDVASALSYGSKFRVEIPFIGEVEFEAEKAIKREEELGAKRKEAASNYSSKHTSLYFDTIRELQKDIKEDSFRIAVFVDDLDRCLPENAIRLLESIKLFLDIEGYIFVIGVDKAVVEKGIAYHYKHLDFNHEDSKSEDKKNEKPATIKSRDYLDKMIQFPLDLPPIEPKKKIGYITSLLGKKEDENLEYKKYAGIIEKGIGNNPRSLKRYINLLAFISRHADTIKESVEKDTKETNEHRNLIKQNFVPVLYIKWSIIVFAFPSVYSDIKGNPNRLIELQQLVKADVEPAKFEIADRLRQVLAEGREFPFDKWLLEKFVYLTQSTKISDAKEKAEKGYSQNLKPGDMVLIPAGKFLYGDDKIEKEIGYDYYMGAFPVTNAEYQEFINAVPDHFPPEHWEGKRTFPEGKENHPVTFVSWNDANAFCEWKSKNDSNRYKYRLPTEEEWEKAARGEDGRVYPWGYDFDKDRFNSYESAIKGTSEVTSYPQGKSPYGCYDMVGNVWEWCADQWDKTISDRVVRGQGWRTSVYDMRLTARMNWVPDSRSNNLGFRLLRVQEKEQT